MLLINHCKSLPMLILWFQFQRKFIFQPIYFMLSKKRNKVVFNRDQWECNVFRYYHLFVFFLLLYFTQQKHNKVSFFLPYLLGFFVMQPYFSVSIRFFLLICIFKCKREKIVCEKYIQKSNSQCMLLLCPFLFPTRGSGMWASEKSSLFQ